MMSSQSIYTTCIYTQCARVCVRAFDLDCTLVSCLFSWIAAQLCGEGGGVNSERREGVFPSGHYTIYRFANP